MKQTYKTPEALRARLTQRRNAIKAAGGLEYAALLAKEREARARYRIENRESYVKARRRHDARRPFKTELCAQARFRGRKRGIEATITPADLVWPTHCPVLGIELDYPTHSGMRGKDPVQNNWPSLDRWDNSRGYVPGNVFVISYRANTLKNTATLEEVMKVAAYLRSPPGCVAADGWPLP